MIDLEPKAEYFDYINERLGSNYNIHNATLITSLKHDKIQAVLAFHTYVKNERRIDFSIASNGRKSWFSKELAEAAIFYLFNYLDVNRVQVYISPENKAAGLMALSLGCIHEATLTDWYGPNKNAALFYLLKVDLEHSGLWRLAHGISNKVLH
jgi:RimJ/RimL family protein N-acetyltransferase